MDYPAGTSSSPFPLCNPGGTNCKTLADNQEKPLVEHGMEDENHSSDETIFVGGAQSHSTTLQKLAMDTLDLSWPNWRNYENPETYIIPPIFSYTNPEKSDQDCHDKKERLRQSEWAEHIVYKAICASAQKKRAAPILVVHSLDLDRIKNHLPHIFPNVQICQNDPYLREYDFVLIGPKIGLVVIEVKSSEFSGPSDFKSKHLPKGIEHGIKQLQYFAENFVNFLQKCIGLKWPEESPVRRILFMPNLERARHEEWCQQYQKAEPLKGSFDHSEAHTIKWFKDDLDNGQEHMNDPELLTTISKLLDEEPKKQTSPVIYEAYASIIAAQGSVIVFKNQSTKKLDPLKLFQREAILRESSRIETQDPGGYLKKGKVKEETLKHFSKVILPTRQQLEVLKGPNRQFIIGSAGTGKTVVLQEKALQLLGKGLKVLIVAPNCYTGRYKEFLESNSLRGYTVRPLEAMRNDFWGVDTSHDIFLERFKNQKDPVEAVYKNLKHGKDENSAGWRHLETYLDQWIAHFDAILIDDAIERLAISSDLGRDYWMNSFKLDYVTVMAYIELKFPNMILWIALDLSSPDCGFYDFYKWVGPGGLGSVFEKGGFEGFSCSFLNRVMRSSENIYRVVYDNNVRVLPSLRLSIGHKVVGSEVAQIRDYYGCSADYDSETIWVRIKMELDGLLAQETPLSLISIVVGGSCCDKRNVMVFLIEKLDKCGIPTITRQWIEDYQQDGRRSGIGEALSINYWDDVSSLEWPIVIYVAAYRGLDDEYYRIQRYRACTRATTKLIEITASPVDL